MMYVTEWSCLIADEALTANRAAAPRIELPPSIAATMRSRRSRDSGAGMTSPPTDQNRLPRISIPDSAQPQNALIVQHAPELCREIGVGERLEDDLEAWIEPAMMHDGIPGISGGVEHLELWLPP